MRTIPLRSLRVLLAVWFSTCVLALTSCGKKHEFTEVTGKVTFNGKPVTAGSVFFVAANDANVSGGGSLGPDGSFKCSVPVGKVKMAVQTAAFKPKPKDAGATKGSPGPRGGVPDWAKSSGKKDLSGKPSSDILSKTGGESGAPAVGTDYVPIPEKYEQIDTAGLDFEIKRGTVNDLGEIKLTGTAPPTPKQ